MCSTNKGLSYKLAKCGCLLHFENLWTLKFWFPIFIGNLKIEQEGRLQVLHFKFVLGQRKFAFLQNKFILLEVDFILLQNFVFAQKYITYFLFNFVKKNEIKYKKIIKKSNILFIAILSDPCIYRVCFAFPTEIYVR